MTCDCAARLAAIEQRLDALEAGKWPKAVDLAEFEQWWAKYPKKVGKQAALKAFRNAQNRPRIDDLLAALRRACTSEQWRKDGGQFIPNPATWLNQGRWDDEPVQIAPVQPKAQVKVERTPAEQRQFEPPPPGWLEAMTKKIGKSM